MPAQVQHRPSEHMTRSVSEKFHDHEHVPINRNAQHKEALRLALGSILAPKRPFTPSRSSSGTASPAYPHSYQHSGPHSAPVPSHTCHSDGQQTPDYLLHPYSHHRPAPHHHGHSHPHPHAHTPSRLGLTDSVHPSGEQTPASRLASVPGTPHSGSHPSSPHQRPSSAGQDLSPPPLHLSPPSAPASEPPSPRPVVDAPVPIVLQAPAQAPAVASPPQVHVHPPFDGDPMPSGAATPRAKFLETLQSNRAWEALIHGSFS